MKLPSARIQPSPRKHSALRRIFSSEARHVHSSFTAPASHREALEARYATVRNEQWIYL